MRDRYIGGKIWLDFFFDDAQHQGQKLYDIGEIILTNDFRDQSMAKPAKRFLQRVSIRNTKT